jgi:NADH dehydrogenase
MQTKNILIVGGGAGGLELATKLGRKYKNTNTKVTLIDKNHTHLWKPLLHEIATGVLDYGTNEISYLACAYTNHFQFELGSLCGLDRVNKTISLAEIKGDDEEIIAPKRELHYDALVLAVGSVSNDFGCAGIADHCLFLDSIEQAKTFHHKMLEHFMQFDKNKQKDKVEIAIVGGGATGVELCAELNHAVEGLYSYGYKNLNNHSISITLIEAGPRILPLLTESLAKKVAFELTNLNIDIKTNTIIKKADEKGFYTQNGDFIPADMMVWAAGIKAPEFLKEFNLENDRLNRLVVKKTLQTSQDDSIFVIGDCASCIDINGNQVPPRAQSAHQMANLCFTNIQAYFNNSPLEEYEYKDYGSFVSLSNSAVGGLMGSLIKGTMVTEGRMAKFVYISLYRMHQIAIFGFLKTGLIMLVDNINKILKPKLKLH